MRILLIHNPKAGDRKHSKKQLMAGLARCGHQTLYQSIKERGWRKALKKPVDLVIAAGGDGTVGKTAWKIMGSGIPLAIFPLGTANNLTRSLGFSAPVDEIIQCEKARPFDVGSARSSSRTEYFLEAAGGGLFADYFPVAEAREKKGASPEEQLAGHMSLLRELALNYPARRWKMTADGEDISGLYILWGAMNIRSAGPALHLAPKATTDDGRLDFVGVREDEREIFIKHRRSAPGRTKGTRSVDAAQICSAQNYVTARRDTSRWQRMAEMRGETTGNSRGAVEITIKPAALTIWLPGP